MTEEKFKDIVSTMIEWGFLDPGKAILDPVYFTQTFNEYIQAANIARKMMNMEPLV